MYLHILFWKYRHLCDTLCLIVSLSLSQVKAMLHDIQQNKRPPTRATTARSTQSTRRVPPRPTVLPEYISRRDGTVILRL